MISSIASPMASSMALKRISTSRLVNKPFNPVRFVAASPVASSRSFNTNSDQLSPYDDRERSLDVNRRSDSSLDRRGRSSSGVVADVFDPFELDPFSPTRSLSQIFNMMDQMMDTPFMTTSRGGGGRRGWDAKEDENGLYVKIDMPGLGKEDVKVRVEQDTLIIKGEGGDEGDGEGEGRLRYSSRIDLPDQIYKLDEIKAEMKNGVLRLFIPKVKEEERTDVHEVKVE